jgi:hypothetical protein
MLGILPLLFFAAYVYAAVGENRAVESLWMCHVSNVILGIGMLAQRPFLVRMVFPWLVFGVPLWLIDVASSGDERAVSSVSHIGGFLLGLYAIWRMRVPANPWLASLLLFLVFRQLCRWLTPASFNVNLSHSVYTGWEDWFSNYPIYWVVTTLVAAASLWGIGRLMIVAFPPRPQDN